MNTVKVSKHELLQKLKANRESHKQLYKQALEGYRALAIEELEKNLATAKSGGEIVVYVTNLARPPEDHTEDYDQAIAMLEMSVDNEIMLSSHDFQAYVMDKWQWSHQVKMLNATYAGGSAPKDF